MVEMFSKTLMNMNCNFRRMNMNCKDFGSLGVVRMVSEVLMWKQTELSGQENRQIAASNIIPFY